MSGRKFFNVFLIITATLAVGLTGCSSEGDRGCLGIACTDGGGSNLGGGSSDTEVVTVASGFTCSIASDYTVVQHNEQFGVLVTAQGTFTPPLQITTGLQYGVESFYQSIKVFGSISNTTSAGVKRSGGVTIKDSAGKTASCSYTAIVLPQNSPTALGCDIVPSTNVPAVGGQVTFQFLGRGGNGTFAFSEFRPYPERLLADTSITKISNTESRAGFSYSTRVTRFASVIVTSGSAISACRTPIFVGGSLPYGYQPGWDWTGLPPWFGYGGGFYPPPTTPVTPPSSNTCDIITSPSPGLAGTLTNLKVVPPASLAGGPFEIAGLTEALPGISGVNQQRGIGSLIDDLPLITRPSALERKIRFRDPGTHTVTVHYRNAAGTVRGSCRASHRANTAGGFTISPDQSNAFSINTYAYNGTATPTYGPTASVPDTTHRGARVAMADVNGDGVADVIIGSGKDTVNLTNPIYRVVVRDGRNFTTVLYDFNPLPSHPDGNGGVFVAGGDLNADGKAEIIVGQDADYVAGKSASWIKIYNVATGSPVLSHAVQPFAANYGVRVAVGDVNGDGFSDVIAIPGKEGGALLKAYNGRLLPAWTTLFTPFNAISTGLHSGAFVATGDVDGDGKAEILTSLDTKVATDGTNYKHSVYLYNSLGTLLDYMPTAYGVAYEGGIRIAAGDLDADGRADILTVPGSGSPPDIFASSFKAIDFITHLMGFNFAPYSFNHTQGMYVGAGAGGL